MKERRWAASEPNLFLLKVFSLRQVTQVSEEVKMGTMALWSDLNW